MPEPENEPISNPPPSQPRHLQEYFAGVVGIPPKPDKQQSVTMVAHSDGTGSAVVATGSGEVEEINRLRRLVHEKDHAVFRAVLSASDLRQQLEDVKAETESLKVELAQAQRPAEQPGNAAQLSDEARREIEKQRKEWHLIQKSMEKDHDARRGELASVRGQLYQTEQKLALESRARRAEGARASAKISNLEQNLVAANSVIAATQAKAAGSGMKKRMAIAFASLVLIAGAGAVWTQLPVRAGAPPTVSQALAPTKPPAMIPPESRRFVFTGSQPGFQGSLSRLNAALSGFGNRPPEEVLSEIRRRSGDQKLCAFQWNNGQPSLLYGSEGMGQTLASSLGRCAAAVEKYNQ